MQAKDAELDKKIAELQTYVDSEITATEDWATATFSTLEQYEAVQTAISEINALIKSTQESITALEEKLDKKIDDDIAAAVADVNADITVKVTEITNGYTTAIADASDAITAAYTDAIKRAITASETSMKEWVNGVLADGYYTKAEIDGKITALQTQVTEDDAALQNEIDALETALAKAESDLTAAYEKAIEDAINENNGKISAEIAAAVKTAQDDLQAQIDDIKSEIQGIEGRLTSIESAVKELVGRIQSIRFMPEYSDGCVTFGYKTHSVTLDFKISPASVASELQTSWQSDPNIIEGYILYTITRSSNEPIPLDVVDVTGNEDGILTVKLAESSGNPLSDAFWNGEQNASVYITINDGNNDIQSELIPTTYTEFEIVEENNEVTYYVDALPGLLKWAYDVNVLGKKDANFVLEADVELPQYEIRQDDFAQTYSYTDTPITVDANGIPSGSNWVPIGVDAPRYSGILDGKGNTINGLRINTSKQYAGFIAYAYAGTGDDDSAFTDEIMESVLICNLTINNAVVYSTSSDVGAIIGRTLNIKCVDNCHVTNSKIRGLNNTGAVIGQVYTRKWDTMTVVSDCTVDENTVVTGTSSTGGIVGYNYGSLFLHCNNAASVTGTTNVGGIAGFSRDYHHNRSAYIIACGNTGSVTASGGIVGGITGGNLKDNKHNGSEAGVIACWSTAQTISGTSKMGLLVGENTYTELIYGSWAAKTSGLSALLGNSSSTACYAYDSASVITQSDMDAMNEAIATYNSAHIGKQSYCPYKWTWTEGNWPTLSVVNQ